MKTITENELLEMQKEHNHHIRAHYACGCVNTCRCKAPKEDYTVNANCFFHNQKTASTKNKVVVCDFDGVLHQYSKKWHDGTIYDPPVEGAKEGMQRLKDKGFELVIYSTRNHDRNVKGKFQKNQVEEMKTWLKKYGIPYDSIHTGVGKPIASLYIDDNAVRFSGNWVSMQDKIDKNLPLQQKEAVAELESNDLDELLVSHMDKVARGS